MENCTLNELLDFTRNLFFARGTELEVERTEGRAILKLFWPILS